MRNRLRERYEDDAMFGQVVDMLRGVILESKLTPSEVRDAALLACLMNEEQRLRVIVREGDDLRYATDAEIEQYRRQGLIR